MFVIPIRTDRPRLRPAYFTVTLMALNIAVHVYGAVLPPVEKTIPIADRVVRYEEPRLIHQFGLRGSDPSPRTFVGHMFVHGDWLHLAGNMLFLWIFGSLIEDVLRPWGMAALYFGGGILAGLAHLAMSHLFGQDLNVPMVGASGAIAAIMGLFMLRFYKTRVEIFYFYWLLVPRWGTFWVHSVWALLFWIVLEILGGLIDAASGPAGGGVAHWAHVGGFFAGLICAPFVGGVSGAREEYFTDDPETAVEYLRRSEVAAALEREVRADPGNAYKIWRLAKAYADAGEVERATRAYQQCVYRFAIRNMLEQATAVYQELVDYDEGATLPPEIHQRIAQALEAIDPSRAIRAYSLLLRHHPARPEGEFALLRLAVLHAAKLQQPHQALHLLRQFLERYPNSQWAAQARQAYENLERRCGLPGDYG